ncbi:hypothetical protein [Massilia rubra]|uniref:Uncharacterized protein n=1 Tax=Massilia rubra TaxID=2607910 RepID=A0ABX0LNK3_9BURK|nr:hypothetical protein [Massilia rubra]NHZ36239.1 hypothetical protein [Massilia rubra]
MITKKMVLQLSLALTKAEDIDLLKGGAIFSTERLSAPEQDAAREIASIVHELCTGYSYLHSPEFLKSIDGKSFGVIDMRTKLEASPSKRTERLERFYECIRNAADNPATLRNLIPENRIGMLERLSDLLMAPNISAE